MKSKIQAELPINVILCAPAPGQCGIGDYSLSLSRELEKQNVTVTRINPGESSPAISQTDIVHIQHEYFLYGGVAPWKNRFWRYLKIIKRPIVLTAHEFVRPIGPFYYRAAIQLTNKMTFGNSKIHCIIVHTEHDRKQFLKSGIKEDHIKVVRHGVPSTPKLPDRKESRDFLELTDEFTVTIFGFLSKKKGHMEAIKTMKLLPPSLNLIFAGGKHPEDTTAYVSNIEDEIKNAGLSDRVRITGYLNENDVLKVMAATDLVLAPFTETSGSGSLAMAFSCARPILASDIKPHQEYIEETPGCVMLYPSGNIKQLAEMIDMLQKNQAMRNALAEGASKYRHEHTFSRMAAETIQIYRSVCTEGA
jgi:glycosyltransferase involved in cell wall biosynthesis